MKPSAFQRAILAWYQRHGRASLPWRLAITPYRIWVSEVMLQQTQVATVTPYFLRFMARFPDIVQLAKASIDDVFALWAGLGYYSRAKNLHATAQRIVAVNAGVFPNTVDELQQLPGIGRSTAGAIAAIAFNTSAPILDGNVKRILARFAAIEGWPGRTEVSAQLWELAEHYTPSKHVANYTQAMMDLGATVCTRHNPKCSLCPIQSGCQAFKNDDIAIYPGRKPPKKIPEKPLTLLLLTNSQQEVLLVKRPLKGIWGGLWSFPECPYPSNHSDIIQWSRTHLHCDIKALEPWPSFKHTLTHFHLIITPVIATVRPLKSAKKATATPEKSWHKVTAPSTLAVAAPIKQLLAQLQRLG